MQAVLTWADVHEMREDYTTGDFTYQQLADRHRISPTMVAKIIHNQRWTDATYTPRLNGRGPRNR